MTWIVTVACFALAWFVPVASYCLLAGWSLEGFFLMLFLGPALWFFLLMMAILTGFIESDETRPRGFRVNWIAAFGSGDKMLPGARLAFWTGVICSTLPIIMNATSSFAGMVGYKELATTLYDLRYASFAIVVVASVVVLMLISIVIDALNAAERLWARISRK